MEFYGIQKNKGPVPSHLWSWQLESTCTGQKQNLKEGGPFVLLKI